MSRLIIANAIVPRFRANDFAGGIARGVDDIISVLTGDAAEWQQRAAQRPDATPGWASTLMVILVLIVFGLVFLSLIGMFADGARNIRRGRSGRGWSTGRIMGRRGDGLPVRPAVSRAVEAFPVAAVRSAAAAPREAGKGST